MTPTPTLASGFIWIYPSRPDVFFITIGNHWKSMEMADINQPHCRVPFHKFFKKWSDKSDRPCRTLISKALHGFPRRRAVGGGRTIIPRKLLPLCARFIFSKAIGIDWKSLEIIGNGRMCDKVAVGQDFDLLGPPWSAAVPGRSNLTCNPRFRTHQTVLASGSSCPSARTLDEPRFGLTDFDTVFESSSSSYSSPASVFRLGRQSTSPLTCR